MLRALPPAAIESFSTSIQPLLISSCAAAGCHGSASKGNFSLIRVPIDRFSSRRLTQRKPARNAFVARFPKSATEPAIGCGQRSPHGSVTSAVFDTSSPKYRQLLIWIGTVTQKPVWESDVAHQPASIRPIGVNPAHPGIPRFNPALGGSPPRGNQGGDPSSEEIPATAAADTDTRPVRQSHRVRPDGNPASTRPDRHLNAEAAVPAAPTTSTDPYDADAFNRQFSDAGKADAAANVPPARPNPK